MISEQKSHYVWSIILTFSPMWNIQKIYETSESTHSMDIEIIDTLLPPKPPQSLCRRPGFLHLWYWYHSSSKGSVCVWAGLSSKDYLKETFLVRIGLQLWGPIGRKSISCVCHRSMKLCAVECRVTGAGALLRWRADGQGVRKPCSLSQLKTEMLQGQGGRRACRTFLSVENNQRWGNERKIKFLRRDVSSKFNAGAIFSKQRTFCFYRLWLHENLPLPPPCCVFFFLSV